MQAFLSFSFFPLVSFLPKILPPHCVLSHFSHVWLFATPWTVACQASLSMGFFQTRTLAWVAIFFSRGSPNPGIEPRSPKLQADCLPSEPPGKPYGGGRFKREGIYVYLWLIHVVIWQKPTQHCKAIILQIKFKKRNQWYFEYGTMNVDLYMQLYILWKYFCNYM